MILKNENKTKNERANFFFVSLIDKRLRCI